MPPSLKLPNVSMPLLLRLYFFGSKRKGRSLSRRLLSSLPLKYSFSCVVLRTTSKCRRMKEYLTAGDLRRDSPSHGVYHKLTLPPHLPADLTPEEVAAIDEAGLRGLPLTLKLKYLLSAQSLRYWLLLFMLLSSLFYIIHQIGPQRKRWIKCE